MKDLNTVWGTSDLIGAGLAYTVMGILIVFLILVIIMMVIKAMALLSGEKKVKKPVVEAPVQSAPETVSETAPETDDLELVAVITAAIAAMTGESTSDFVVRSYKKVHGNAWNKAGRMEVLDNRF